MSGCIGWLILMPFVGVWWLTIKAVDACIKKSNTLRPVGIIISLLVGAGSIYAGYSIGPIVGWFIMACGGFIAVLGVWRSMVVTREYMEAEKLEEKLEKERNKEEQEVAIKEAKEILEQGEIDDYERVDWICSVLDRIKFSWEGINLSEDLKQLKQKQIKREKKKLS